MAGDWVSQYTEALAGPNLPDDWPTSALVLDHITLKWLNTDGEVEPKQSETVAVHVFGAKGDQDDIGADQGERLREPKLHALGVYKWLAN